MRLRLILTDGLVAVAGELATAVTRPHSPRFTRKKNMVHDHKINCAKELHHLVFVALIHVNRGFCKRIVLVVSSVIQKYVS